MPWGFWAGYLEKLAIVALLLAALYAVARGLRRARLFSRAGRALTLIESIALSQHAAVHVVKAGARYFLIGSTAARLCALAELTENEGLGITTRR